MPRRFRSRDEMKYPRAKRASAPSSLVLCCGAKPPIGPVEHATFNSEHGMQTQRLQQPRHLSADIVCAHPGHWQGITPCRRRWVDPAGAPYALSLSYPSAMNKSPGSFLICGAADESRWSSTHGQSNHNSKNVRKTINRTKNKKQARRTTPCVPQPAYDSQCHKPTSTSPCFATASTHLDAHSAEGDSPRGLLAPRNAPGNRRQQALYRRPLSVPRLAQHWEELSGCFDEGCLVEPHSLGGQLLQHLLPKHKITRVARERGCVRCTLLLAARGARAEHFARMPKRRGKERTRARELPRRVAAWLTPLPVCSIHHRNDNINKKSWRRT